MGAHGQSLAIPLFCSFLFTLFPCSSVGSFRKKPLQHGSFPQASVPSGSIHLLRSVGCSVGCGMDICPGVVLFMGCREIPAPQWSGGWQHLPLPTGLVLTLSLTPHCQVALGPFLNRLSQGTGSSEGLICAPRGAAAEPVVSGMGEALVSPHRGCPCSPPPTPCYLHPIWLPIKFSFIINKKTMFSFFRDLNGCTCKLCLGKQKSKLREKERVKEKDTFLLGIVQYSAERDEECYLPVSNCIMASLFCAY